MFDPWLVVALAVVLAYTIEAATGFGSIVIAMSIGALLLPIPALVPVLVPLNILMSGPMVWLLRRDVQWPLLLKQILPLMGLGVVLGLWARDGLDAALLKRLFGLLILWFAGRSLWLALKHPSVAPHPTWLTRVLTLGAGVTHGLFASGGPLLVYGMTGTQLDKARFRATLLAVWLGLNGSLTLWFLFAGQLTAVAPRIVSLAAAVALGALAGNWLHRRIDEKRFRLGVLALLMLTGSLLVVR